jgi:hypothetical protein
MCPYIEKIIMTPICNILIWNNLIFSACLHSCSKLLNARLVLSLIRSQSPIAGNGRRYLADKIILSKCHRASFFCIFCRQLKVSAKCRRFGTPRNGLQTFIYQSANGHETRINIKVPIPCVIQVLAVYFPWKNSIGSDVVDTILGINIAIVAYGISTTY